MKSPHPGHFVGPAANVVMHAGHVRLSESRSITAAAEARPCSESSLCHAASIQRNALSRSSLATASQSFVPHELHCAGGGRTISDATPWLRSAIWIPRK